VQARWSNESASVSCDREGLDCGSELGPGSRSQLGSTARRDWPPDDARGSVTARRRLAPAGPPVAASTSSDHRVVRSGNCRHIRPRRSGRRPHPTLGGIDTVNGSQGELTMSTLW